MLKKFTNDCRRAWDELAGHFAAIESPAARVAVIICSGLMAILIFMAVMPWALLVAVPVAAVLVIGKKKSDDEKKP